MPELPEVETTRRGIAPHLEGRSFEGATIRQGKLRQPVPPDLGERIAGLEVQAVTRRAKYLLIDCGDGSLIIHLGMSGSLRILPRETPAAPHDHVDLLLGEKLLRYRDPRRFGMVLWHPGDPADHPLLRQLGPEPLGDGFDGSHLHQASRGRSIAVKSLIMENRIVVGVGNIYANESLFLAKIHPRRAANRIAAARYQVLADQIKQVLTKAIEQGGTTLRDFQNEEGKPGYFQQELQVYGRTGEPCPNCGQAIRQETIGQRSSFFCGHCQR
jgi:formamidopyrimidine-DNA glycosylase